MANELKRGFRRALVVIAILASVLTATATASIATAPEADAACESQGGYTSRSSYSITSWGCYNGHRSVGVFAQCSNYGWTLNYSTWTWSYGYRYSYSLGSAYLGLGNFKSFQCARGDVISVSVWSSTRWPTGTSFS